MFCAGFALMVFLSEFTMDKNGRSVLYRGDNFGQMSQTINLNDASKTANAYPDLEVKTTGKDKNAMAAIVKVKINYPGYRFTVENIEFTDGAYSNVYTEKIYIDDADARLSSNGYRNKLGNKIKNGGIKAAKNAANVSGTPINGCGPPPLSEVQV